MSPEAAAPERLPFVGTGKRQISRVSEPASRRQDHLGCEHRSLQKEAIKGNEEPFPATLRMGRLIYGRREALRGWWAGGEVMGRFIALVM